MSTPLFPRYQNCPRNSTNDVPNGSNCYAPTINVNCGGANGPTGDTGPTGPIGPYTWIQK